MNGQNVELTGDEAVGVNSDQLILRTSKSPHKTIEWLPGIHSWDSSI